jgi:hypothetical protein
MAGIFGERRSRMAFEIVDTVFVKLYYSCEGVHRLGNRAKICSMRPTFPSLANPARFSAAISSTV